MTGKRPGHFVALLREGRLDAMLGQSGRLVDMLEKRRTVPIFYAQFGKPDESLMVSKPDLKTLETSDVTIAMPGIDGAPVVTDDEWDAWVRWRVAWDISLVVPPYTVTGVMLLIPSMEPASLAESSGDTFVPVFAPSVCLDGMPLPEVPSDALLLNRRRITKVNATLRR